MPREAFAEWRRRFGRTGGTGDSLLDLLRRAQAAHGEVSRQDLRRIAEQLRLPVAAVTGTATFYADFEAGPRGRRHVRVCEGTACFAATSGRHVRDLEAALGVRRGACAPDGSVSLQGVYCLGFCYASPAALEGGTPRTGPGLGGLIPGPAAAGALEPDRPPAPGRAAGTAPGPDRAGPAATPRTRGRGPAADRPGGRAGEGPGDRCADPGTKPRAGSGGERGGARAVPWEETGPPVPYRCAARRAVVLAGLVGEEEPWSVWPHVLAHGTPRDVLAAVAAAGLRGRGGAEFPVAAKWAATARGPAPRYVVANGDEGDPGSYCDRLLMEQDPHRVLEGLALAGFAAGANRGVVLVRSEYPAAVARMRAAAAEARAAGYLGAGPRKSGFGFDVQVVEGAGSYVAGEETALLHLLQGLRGSVRARPPYPVERGLDGAPTAVNNVETLAAVPWIVRHGGEGYARLGAAGEPGTKLVCLSERFARPGVYEVEFGVPLRSVVEDLGGGLRAGHTLRAVQVGGPLGGFLAADELDLPLAAAPLAEAGVALGHGSLVAIDTGVEAAALLRHLWAFGAAESCGACAPCRIGTRRGLELSGGAVPPAPPTTAGAPGTGRTGGAGHPSAGAKAPPDTGPSEAGTGAGAETGPTAGAGAEAEAVSARPAGAARAEERLIEVMAAGSLCAFGRGVAGAVRSLLRVYGDELRPGGGP